MSWNYMRWKIIWVEIIWAEIIWVGIIWVEIIWNVTDPLRLYLIIIHSGSMLSPCGTLDYTWLLSTVVPCSHLMVPYAIPDYYPKWLHALTLWCLRLYLIIIHSGSMFTSCVPQTRKEISPFLCLHIILIHRFRLDSTLT